MTARHSRSALAAALALLSGCVSVQKTVPAGAPPEATSAYIAGVFERNPGMNYGFYVADVVNGSEFLLAFGLQTSTDVASKAAVTLIAVPPGRYAVKAWARLGDINGGEAIQKGRNELKPESPLAKPFDVKAGEVVHLGRFAGTSTSNKYGAAMHYEWKIDPVELTYPAAAASLAKKYPAFAAVPMTCLFCTRATGPLEPGLGTFDPARALFAVAEGKAARAQLEAFFAARKEELAQRQAPVEELKKARDAENDRARRDALEEQLSAKLTELGELRKELQARIEGEEDRLLKPILDGLKATAEELKAAKGLKRVAAKNAQVATGVDLTDELVAAYDAKHPVAAPAAAAAP